MSREVCLHGELTSNYCAQCEAEYDDQVTAVAQRLRRAEWIRNNVATFSPVGIDLTTRDLERTLESAEGLADELIKRGYL